MPKIPNPYKLKYERDENNKKIAANVCQQPTYSDRDSERKNNHDNYKIYYKWISDIIAYLISSINYHLNKAGLFSFYFAKVIGWALKLFLYVIDMLVNGSFFNTVLKFTGVCILIIGTVFFHIFVFLLIYYQLNFDKASYEFRKLMKGMDNTSDSSTTTPLNKKLGPLLTNSYIPKFSFSKLITSLYIQIGFNNILNETDLVCRTPYTNDMGQCDDIKHISGKYIKGGKLTSCYNLKKPNQINWNINDYLGKFTTQEPSHFELIKNEGRFKENYDQSHYDKINNQFLNDYKFNDIKIKWLIKDNKYKLDCNNFYYNNNKQSFVTGLKCTNK